MLTNEPNPCICPDLGCVCCSGSQLSYCTQCEDGLYMDNSNRQCRKSLPLPSIPCACHQVLLQCIDFVLLAAACCHHAYPALTSSALSEARASEKRHGLLAVHRHGMRTHAVSGVMWCLIESAHMTVLRTRYIRCCCLACAPCVYTCIHTHMPSPLEQIDLLPLAQAPAAA
jgi:hypothetical protein